MTAEPAVVVDKVARRGYQPRGGGRPQMHFRRSLAGVALLGVFAAMAFAGAATGAPAQPQQSTTTAVSHHADPRVGGGQEDDHAVRWRFQSAVRGRYAGGEGPVHGRSAAALGEAETADNEYGPSHPERTEAGRAELQGGSGRPSATAAATADPIVAKDLTTISRTGVNAWQQATFSPFGPGGNLEPPDPSVCAGNNFAVQVVKLPDSDLGRQPEQA